MVSFNYSGKFDGSDGIGINRYGPNKFNLTVWMRRGDYRVPFKLHRDNRDVLESWVNFPIGKQLRFAFTMDENDRSVGPDGLPWRNV